MEAGKKKIKNRRRPRLPRSPLEPETAEDVQEEKPMPSDEEVIKEKGYQRFLVWKIKQSFPKRTEDDFEREFDTYIDMNTRYEIHSHAELSTVLKHVAASRHVPIVVDVVWRNVVFDMMISVLKEWYVTWHGSFDDGLEILSTFFKTRTANKVQDLLQPLTGYLPEYPPFLETVFEEPRLYVEAPD